MRVRYGSGPARLKAGAGWTVKQHYGDRATLPFRRENVGLLTDEAESKGASRAVRRTRRAYAHIVGGSDELRMAGRTLRSRARQNARSIGVTFNLYRSIKMRRDRSSEGVPVDYEVYSDDPNIGAIEWGFVPKSSKRAGGNLVEIKRHRKVPGHFVMTNAARGLGPIKWRKRGAR